MAKFDPHAIRIVPIKTPEPAAAARRPSAAAQRLTFRGGPLLTAVQVTTLFWGAAWTKAQAAVLTDINQFFGYIVGSPLIDQLAEYSAPGFAIGHGAFAGTATITDSEPGASITDAQIQTFLSTHPAAKKARRPRKKPPPPAVDNNLTFLFMPPGTVVSMGGSASCTGFCGYHNHINGKRFYAVMPFPGCSGCTGGMSEFDALTVTSSHELCEAITDPIPGQGWYNDQYGEIGDICAWKTRKLGAYEIQQEWSNKASSCQ